MEHTQLQRLDSQTEQPRAFVYRNAESTCEPPHPLRRRGDKNAVSTRPAAASALLRFRVYVKAG